MALDKGKTKVGLSLRLLASEATTSDIEDLVGYSMDPPALEVCSFSTTVLPHFFFNDCRDELFLPEEVVLKGPFNFKYLGRKGARGSIVATVEKGKKSLRKARVFAREQIENVLNRQMVPQNIQGVRLTQTGNISWQSKSRISIFNSVGKRIHIAQSGSIDGLIYDIQRSVVSQRWSNDISLLWNVAYSKSGTLNYGLRQEIGTLIFDRLEVDFRTSYSRAEKNEVPKYEKLVHALCV